MTDDIEEVKSFAKHFKERAEELYAENQILIKENENIKSSCECLIEAGVITLKQRDDLMKALKSLVCVAEKDEINKKHLDVTLRKARNIIADIDPTIEKCDCCY
jgi:hypothetical protein